MNESSTRSERFVLCRKNIADIGDPAKYCAKSIATPNEANLCDDHKARLPIWPLNDDGTICSPKIQEVA